MKTISRFKDEYEFLHNYYPHSIEYEGITYPTNEHAFQAAKSLDPKIRKQIAACQTPGKAKELGNRIPLRPDWESVKTDVMDTLCRTKFADPSLRAKLLATAGSYLIEGNHWGDTCWGMVNGKGENRLGKILMVIRDEALQEEQVIGAQASIDAQIVSAAERTTPPNKNPAEEDKDIRR